MQGGVLVFGKRGVHGEVRLFAVHGHHLGERLQLKCTGKRGGIGYKSWKTSHRYTVIPFAYPVNDAE